LKNDQRLRYETPCNAIGSVIYKTIWNIREQSRKQFEEPAGRRCTKKIGLSGFEFFEEKNACPVVT